MSALLLFLQLGIRASADEPSPALLENMANAPWSETRNYTAIEDTAERHAAMLEDFAFDAWVADRARTDAGYRIPETVAREVAALRPVIEEHAILALLAGEAVYTLEELDRVAAERRWRMPIPETHEVSLLHVEAEGLEGEALEAKRERVEMLARELTPENFPFMARMYSDSPSSVRGGRLGTMDLARVGETFRRNVLATETGTVGGPYETPLGWNFILVTAVYPEREKFTEDEVENLMRQLMARDVVNGLKQAGTYLDELDRRGVADLPDVRYHLDAMRNFLVQRDYTRWRAMESAPEPTEADLRALYDELRTGLVAGPRYRVWRVIVTGEDWTRDQSADGWRTRRVYRDEARRLRTDVLAGRVDIAEHARTAEPEWIQEPYHPELDGILRRSGPGEITPPIELDNGFALVKLLEVDPAPRVPFEAVRGRLVEVWYGRLVGEQRETMRAEFAATQP